MPNRKKIGLIGAGNIGGELARLCANKELGDVYLFDIPAKENFAKGKALDLEQNGAILGYDSHVRGTSKWEDLAGADVLIVTAGIPRKPGQSRDDLVATNLPIIRDVANNAKKHCPNAFVIVISNPLDAMVYEYKRVTGCAKGMVAGMAGVLDSARFECFLAHEAHVSVKDVRAMVLGGHGDDMVPVLSMTTINGVPASVMIPKDKMSAIIERTRKGGGEIVNLMGTSAYYAPATAAVAMAEAYLLDQKRLLPCAAYLDGEFGYKDLFMGVPCIVGGNGIEKIIEIPLTDEEKGMLSYRDAVARWYAERYGVTVDPNKEVLGLIGSKEGWPPPDRRRAAVHFLVGRFGSRSTASLLRYCSSVISALTPTIRSGLRAATASMLSASPIGSSAISACGATSPAHG